MKQQGKPEKSNTAALAAQLRAAKGSVKVAGILLVLLPAVIAYLTTAWFANNREVEGSGASVTMAVPGTALYIEAGNVQGREKQYTTAVSNLTLGGGLYPISTADCTNWWYVDGWTLGKASAYAQAAVTPRDDSTAGTASGTYTVGTGENASSYTAYNLLTYTLYTSGGGLNVYLAPDNALTVTGSVDPESGENLSGELVSALRVGVMVDGVLQFIYAPAPELGQGNSQIENAETDTDTEPHYPFYAVTSPSTVVETENVLTDLAAWQANAVYDENSEADAITGYTAGTHSLGTANETGIVVRLYIWLEGTDAQAMLSKSDNALGVSLSVSFVGVETT